MSETIVAIVAHPDDESLIAGGTLALAADAGVATAVVSLTRGEHGPVAGVPPGDGQAIGALRESELEAAGATLGAQWTVCLRHPDGELEWSNHHAVAAELVEILAGRGRMSLLTFGEDGLYWHPDHIAARAIAGIAVDRLEEEHGAQVWLYEAVWPPSLVTDLVAAARERGLPSDLWGLAPEAFGSSTESSTVIVDVRAALSRKLAAIRAHQTQLGPEHLLTALPEDLAERFLGEERWRVARPAGAGEGPLGRLAATG